MVRKQIYIKDAQNRRLKSKAKASRVSEAELIRHAIDIALSAEPAVQPDPHAWEREREFIQGRMGKRVLEAEEKPWTREELYEERLSD